MFAGAGVAAVSGVGVKLSAALMIVAGGVTLPELLPPQATSIIVTSSNRATKDDSLRADVLSDRGRKVVSVIGCSSQTYFPVASIAQRLPAAKPLRGLGAFPELMT